MVRNEPWQTIEVVKDVPKNISFSIKYGSYPPWFSKIAECYEHYKISKLNFTLRSTYSNMASGNAVLSYNTVYQDPISTDRSILLTQKGAKEMKIAGDRIVVVVPPEALQQTPSKKSCRWNLTAGTDTSYTLDVIAQVTASETGTMYLDVGYDVDFYTPQLN